MTHYGFEPYINRDSKILILGSFPSVKSRRDGFYYGNKQNKFWRILSSTLGCETPISIKDKKQLLDRHKIALWDVVISCNIVGSMDKDITEPIIADIRGIVAEYDIKRIVTNGAKAYALFSKHFPELREMCTPLPSTSPANARLDPSIWINAIREITERL